MWPAKLAHPFTMLPRECETPPPKNYEGTKKSLLHSHLLALKSRGA